MQVVKELQRRNVFRVAVGYIVSCWLLAQVADLVLDNIGAPNWVMQTIMLVFALGFPIVLFFSWAYEVTPEGIKRESEVDRTESITHVTGRKLDCAIMLVLVLAVGYFAVDKYLLPDEPNAAVAQTAAEPAVTEASGSAETATDALLNDKSIAVLPFVNMSGDESSTYFSDGLAETVLHMLAQVKDLRIAARTSSFQFRDQAMDIGEIGKQLNVGAVLEGSVQRSGDKVRITAQLIDVSNGFHLWSGNFDRDLNDVFAIQDEIATEVVAALKLSLLGEAASSLASDRTDNLDAYTEYLLGAEKLGSISANNLSAAVQHLQQAIRLDPEYGRAYSTLGRAYLGMVNYGSMRREQGIAAAREAASRALDLNATSSEALAVLGRTAQMDGDVDSAGEILAKAIELSPNDIFALFAYTHYLRHPSIARYEEAIATGRKMTRLDPLSEEANRALSLSLQWLRQYDAALELWNSFLLVRPNSQMAHEYVVQIYGSKGEYAASILRQIEWFDRYPDNPDPEAPFLLGLDLLALDMPDEAQNWFDRAIELDPQHPVSRAAPLFLDYYWRELDEESFQLARELLDAGIDNRITSRLLALDVLIEYGAATGRHAIVLDTLDNLYPHLFDNPPQDIDKDLVGTARVAQALLDSGDIERGKHLLDGVDALRAPTRASTRVDINDVIFSLADKDKAAAIFAEYVQSNPARPAVAKFFIERESLFDVLRDDPVFIEYMAELSQLADDQRQLLQAMWEGDQPN